MGRRLKGKSKSCIVLHETKKIADFVFLTHGKEIICVKAGVDKTS